MRLLIADENLFLAMGAMAGAHLESHSRLKKKIKKSLSVSEFFDLSPRFHRKKRELG